MTDYLARLFYIGDHYYGSQMQPGLKTVQGELIKAISKWSGEPHSSQSVQLSGRTDRGVHSLGQLVMITTDKRFSIDGINKHLPEDIVLWARRQAPEGFRPRSGALMRHYRYFLDESWINVNQTVIKEAISLLVGSNDFNFLSKPDERRNTVTTVLNVSLGEVSNLKFLDVYGTSFLWKFVRKVVTLLTAIGLEKIKPETILDILDGSKKTFRGGIEPAPPENLVLMETIVPFRFTTSKYALRRIQNYLNTRREFLRRSSLTLFGLTDHFSSSMMFYQHSANSHNL
ncbi:MAG: tRNA pseudouridine(38-40) synthase TruA [Candidatus Odinarchaeota archaeon]